MKNNNSSGFTLIELLIVIAIIALLAAISVFALAGARETGRDAKRKADLETIRSALEFYKADCGFYPETFPGGGSEFNGGGAAVCNNNVYIKEMPEDSSAGRDYAYAPLPISDPTSYILCAVLEGNDTEEITCPSCGVACTYKTTNP